MIHESSYVDKGAFIGKNCKIWHFCHIMNGAVIDDGVTLGQNCFIGENVNIGKRVKIQNNVSVYDGVTIEDDVFLGPSVVFTNVLRPRAYLSVNKKYKKTIVKKGATIGANATIICGITIGKYSFIGAGAVVRSNVDDFALLLGVPAKRVGWVGKEGKRLNFKKGVANDAFGYYKLENDKVYFIDKLDSE